MRPRALFACSTVALLGYALFRIKTTKPMKLTLDHVYRCCRWAGVC